MSTETEAPADLLEKEGDAAADYLEGLLDIADLDGDIDIDVEGDRAQVSIVEVTAGELGELVGEDGQVLDALQELARLAAAQATGQRSRLMLDIAGFRLARRRELEALAKTAIDEVKETGEPVRLAAMNAFERKVVHDVVTTAGLVSESEGVDPDRRIVIKPAS
jgi:spoIIIJ-associated protein